MRIAGKLGESARTGREGSAWCTATIPALSVRTGVAAMMSLPISPLRSAHEHHPVQAQLRNQPGRVLEARHGACEPWDRVHQVPGLVEYPGEGERNYHLLFIPERSTTGTR